VYLKKKSIFLIALIVWLPFGCASIAEKASMEKIALFTDAYRDAIRASAFKQAYRFVDPEIAKDQKVDFDRFKNIQVVDYEVSDCGLLRDRGEFFQVAEIEYYARDGLSLRTLSDRQLWKLDDKAGVWLLQTGLPDFQLQSRPD